jgi:uncharacterized protein (DUF2267 family)
MTYDKFIGQVQHRARLASSGEAVAAVRATLQTLAERLDFGEAEDLASQLPQEIGIFLLGKINSSGERFSLGEFFDRLTLRENVDKLDAIFHARCVFEVLGEAVSSGEISDVRAQLPPKFQPLFEGSMGELARKD